MVRMLSVALALGLATTLAYGEDKDKKVTRPVEKLEKKDRPLDKDFLIEAAQCANNCENVLTLVGKHASSDKVKEFAKDVKKDQDALIKDHGKVASAKKVVVVPSLDKETSAKINELKKLDKADFDKAFLAYFIAGAERGIESAQYQKKNGKDSDVSKLADEMATTLQKHLDRAKKLQKEIK